MKPGRITIRENMLVIEAPPHVSIRLRRVFGGAQRYKAGVFELAATPEHAYDLEWFRERHPLDVEPEAEPRFRQLIATQEKKLAAIAAIDAADYVPREFELALPPREYQRVAADLALKTGSLLICDSLGTGKTVTAICTMTTPGVLPALIVTMTHLTRQWEAELHRFAPKLRVHRIRSRTPYDFSDVRIEVDPKTKRRGVVRYNGMPDILIANYQKMDGWVESLAGKICAIYFDECQELRHAKSGGEPTKKYAAAKILAEGVDLRVGCSATPIYNFGEEIYNVLDVIAPGQLGTHSEFLDEWCGERSYDGKSKVADPAALGTYLREAGLMIRRTRKDVGREIPPLTVVRHIVECDPKSIERATADVAELARRVIERVGKPIERMQAASELDWRLRQATGVGKAAAVAEFVRMLVDSGERVLLGGWHHQFYSLIRANFDRQGSEIRYEMFTGEESDSQKACARERFCEGNAQVLIMSNRAGAGLDGLQFVCRTAVIGELDWSPKVIEQFIGRVHRDGQTEPVIAYILVCEEGSDPVISDVLGIKDAQATGIVDPTAVNEPVFQGASDDHIRRLAEDVIRRRNRAA